MLLRLLDATDTGQDLGISLTSGLRNYVTVHSQASDEWFAAGCGVGSVVIVEVEPGR